MGLPTASGPSPLGHRIGPADAAVATELDLLPVLRDNLVPILHNSRQAVVVDPADAAPVSRWLQERQLELVAILHTHHHSDHIGGTPGLLQHWPGAAVVAAAADRLRIPLQTLGVEDGDRLELLGRRLKVLAVPGHTLQHLAYWLEPLTRRDAAASGSVEGDGNGEDSGGDLFCGDSLFAAGCGRMFEGTPEQMQASLQRFASLPPATRVWCAHEYTEANLRWAVTVAPEDAAIRSRLEQVQALRRQGGCTIPSTIALERQTNLMLRAPDAAGFARLRRHKDGFQG